MLFSSFAYFALFWKGIRLKEGSEIDRKKIEKGVRLILEGIGENLDREGLVGTPERVWRMYEEILNGHEIDIAGLLEKTFMEKHDEMVLIRDIPFFSICEHHLLPFLGKAHIGYIPKGRVVGASKMVRVLKAEAMKLQLQERLTKNVADILMDELSPTGVGVVVEAEHLCMSIRGVKSFGAKMVTSAMRGGFRSNETTRAEFLSLIRFPRDSS
jgi:GTP cyclohydrolase I